MFMQFIPLLAHLSCPPSLSAFSMDQEELKKSTPALSVIQRLDRLDQLLQILEGRHCLSEKRRSIHMIKNVEVEPQEQCKTIFSALEEVRHKGTLMERIALLEDRLLQLTLELDVNTSKSSSSIVTIHDKFEHGPESAITEKLHGDSMTSLGKLDNADFTQVSRRLQMKIILGFIYFIAIIAKLNARTNKGTMHKEDTGDARSIGETKESRKLKRLLQRKTKWLWCCRMGC